MITDGFIIDLLKCLDSEDKYKNKIINKTVLPYPKHDHGTFLIFFFITYKHHSASYSHNMYSMLLDTVVDWTFVNHR